MNRAGRLVFLLGILIALVSGAVVYVLLGMSEPQSADVPTTKVVIAFQDVYPRTEIIAEQVGVANWPRALPTPIGAYGDTASVVGKLATAPLPPGQPVTDKILVDKKDLKESHSNASLILETGSVAIAMPVSANTNVANAIQAGDRIDMIATFAAKSATGSGAVTTQRLLGDILVLQVGNWPNSNAKSDANTAASIITLQLKEQDVLVLSYAQQFASGITFVLRPANDHVLLALEPVTLDYINQRFGYKLPR
ncbi:MAG: Flp pilus assembly protein CpaB [Chloroflexi bacterium]|nr:Flp pilus assembly protein CpaB [Chloroflexota bacterium]